MAEAGDRVVLEAWFKSLCLTGMVEQGTWAASESGYGVHWGR